MTDLVAGSATQPAKQSFKKTLVKNQPKEKEIKLGEHDGIDLDDDDVIIDLGGSVHLISFSDRIHNEIKESIKQMVVVHLLAGGLGYKGLEVAIKAIWKPKGHYTIMDLENNYYVSQFAPESDYLHALLDGPWVVCELISGCYLGLRLFYLVNSSFRRWRVG